MFIPKESEEVPGFYEIPGFPNILINKEKQVYSKKRHKLIAKKY